MHNKHKILAQITILISPSKIIKVSCTRENVPRGNYIYNNFVGSYPVDSALDLSLIWISFVALFSFFGLGITKYLTHRNLVIFLIWISFFLDRKYLSMSHATTCLNSLAQALSALHGPSFTSHTTKYLSSPSTFHMPSQKFTSIVFPLSLP